MKARIALFVLAALPTAVLSANPLVESVGIARVDEQRVQECAEAFETSVARARIARRALLTGAITTTVGLGTGLWLGSRGDATKEDGGDDPVQNISNESDQRREPVSPTNPPASWSKLGKNALLISIIFTGANAIVSRLFSSYAVLEQWIFHNARTLWKNDATFHYQLAVSELITEARGLTNHLACLEEIAEPAEAIHLRPRRPAYTSFSLSLVVQHNRFIKALEQFLAAIRVLGDHQGQPLMVVDPHLSVVAADRFVATLEAAITHSDNDGRSTNGLLSSWCQLHDAIYLLVDVWNDELGDA